MHGKLIFVAPLVALIVALPALASAATPASTERAHPSNSAHAAAVAGQADATRIEACTHATTALVGNLDKGDFKGATADFDATMQANLGADKLGAVWQQVSHQFGALQGHGTPQNMLYQGDVVISLPLRFAHGSINAQVACDAAGKVAGFFLRPASAPAAAASSSGH